MDWMNLPPSVDGTLAITLNRDFADAVPTIAEVAEARAAYAAGHLPWQDLVAVYQRAGMVDTDTTAEDLRARIVRDLRTRAPATVAAGLDCPPGSPAAMAPHLHQIRHTPTPPE